MAAEPLPDWMIPPPQGFTAADLDTLPGLPRHTELIDGSLVFSSPQSSLHSVVVDLLAMGLRRAAPRGTRVLRDMSVVLGQRQRPEPDVSVVRPDAELDDSITGVAAGDVLLAIEVVSPDSEERDRERKPVLYAKSGIPHFWRVEQVSGHPTVYVYELDPATSTYQVTGIHHDELKLTVPFEVQIDLTEFEAL